MKKVITFLCVAAVVVSGCRDRQPKTANNEAAGEQDSVSQYSGAVSTETTTGQDNKK